MVNILRMCHTPNTLHVKSQVATISPLPPRPASVGGVTGIITGLGQA